MRAVFGLAHRARSLFSGFIETVGGSAPSAALYLIRPLVEINLMLRFLRRSSTLHTEMWAAEGDRQLLAFLDDHARHSTDLGGLVLTVPEDRLAEMKLRVREAREKARAAKIPGVGGNGKVFPSAHDIAEYLDDEKVWSGYVFAYRGLSWNVHAGYHAFGAGAFVSRRGGLVSYSDTFEPSDLVAVRALAITSFSSTLRMVSEAFGLGVEDEAKEINAFIGTAKFDTSELDEGIGSQEGGGQSETSD